MFLCAKTEKDPQQSKLTGLVVAPNQLLAREVLINTEKIEVNKKKPVGRKQRVIIYFYFRSTEQN